jgi:hypothetical protein
MKTYAESKNTDGNKTQKNSKMKKGINWHNISHIHGQTIHKRSRS